MQLSTLSTKTIFQSTLPRRERRKIDRLCSLRSYFNPRSREGSDRSGKDNKKRLIHFNPRSREGSDSPSPVKSHFSFTISIHAPAKGATSNSFFILLCPLFQSTLPRRERPRGCALLQTLLDFNPRSREGSDIHQSRQRLTVLNFNPRSREGSDVRLHQHFVLLLYHFNPRSREGSDCFPSNSNAFSFISIHAPAKGATEIHEDYDGFIEFQSTLPRRERPYAALLSSFIPPISIHPPAKGATVVASAFFLPTLISIHAPAKGATERN